MSRCKMSVSSAYWCRVSDFPLCFLQHWTVFTEVNEVFILVPALLGLKGNLEMTLASRLSTAVRWSFVDKSLCLLRMAISGQIALAKHQCFHRVFPSLSHTIIPWFNVTWGWTIILADTPQTARDCLRSTWSAWESCHFSGCSFMQNASLCRCCWKIMTSVPS